MAKQRRKHRGSPCGTSQLWGPLDRLREAATWGGPVLVTVDKDNGCSDDSLSAIISLRIFQILER